MNSQSIQYFCFLVANGPPEDVIKLQTTTAYFRYYRFIEKTNSNDNFTELMNTRLTYLRRNFYQSSIIAMNIINYYVEID